MSASGGASSPSSSLLHQWVRAAVCKSLFWIFNHACLQSIGNSVALLNTLLGWNFRNYIPFFAPLKGKIFLFRQNHVMRNVFLGTVFIPYSLCFRGTEQHDSPWDLHLKYRRVFKIFNPLKAFQVLPSKTIYLASSNVLSLHLVVNNINLNS